MKKCIILANGRPPEKQVFEYLNSKGLNYLICADGGANSAKEMGLTPNVIIGDLDSAESSVLDFYKNSSKIIKIKSQNDTDVEKALKYVIKNGYTEAVLLGGTGDRLDHSFCNLGIVFKLYDKIKIYLVSEQSILTAHEKKVEFNTVKGETVSLYGFNDKTKITTEGLKFKLNNEPLPFGVSEGTSNVAKGKKVVLKIRNGRIFVIRNFNFMMDNDLF